MIHRIYSSTLDTFKNLEFRPGLNILLAEKSPGASDLQTRNRAGKTSLIEIIHLLTGANVDEFFKKDELAPHAFGMEFDLGHAVVDIERSSKRLVLKLGKGDISEWPPLPNMNLLGERVISNTLWKNILGSVMFNLPQYEANHDKQEYKYGPSFRSLLNYFVRRQINGGFFSPFEFRRQQQLHSQQVSISYLIGLDWTIPQQWELIREQERGLRELKKEATSTTAELRTSLAVAQSRYDTLRTRVNNFQVLPEYAQFEREAAELTLQMNEFANQNTIDRELVIELERSIGGEIPPSPNDLENLYQEVGVILPEQVLRRFDEVRSFHESVIENRRSYLSGELEAAKRRIREREQNMQKLGNRHTQVMTILNSHGALEQLTELQTELARQEAQTESLRQRFAAAEQLEGRKTELDIERQKLLLRLMQDYQEQNETLNRAIVAFENVSSALYEEAGSLTLKPSLNGPVFDVQIHGARSKGISNMQIFCFDMMLMDLCTERGLGPGFLVHDSHLFDGVDERQVINALQVGAKMAERLNFQYIVTLNSDQVPIDIPDEFRKNFILPVRLTDKTKTGGLFGMRID